MFQLVRDCATLREGMRLQKLEEAPAQRQPWELNDDDSKYMWRMNDFNNNAWCVCVCMVCVCVFVIVFVHISMHMCMYLHSR